MKVTLKITWPWNPIKNIIYIYIYTYNKYIYIYLPIYAVRMPAYRVHPS